MHVVQGADPDVSRRAHTQILTAICSEKSSGNTDRCIDLLRSHMPFWMSLEELLELDHKSLVRAHLWRDGVLQWLAQALNNSFEQLLLEPMRRLNIYDCFGPALAARMAAEWSCNRRLPCAWRGRQRCTPGGMVRVSSVRSR